MQRLIEISKNRTESANDTRIISWVPDSIQTILALVAKITLKVTQELAYRKTSGINRTKSKNLNVSNLVLQLSLLNPLKSGVKSRMKM